MRQQLQNLLARIPSLPTRFHIAFGLLSVLTSVLLLGVFLGFVPDRETAVQQGRVSLAESVAASSSLLLDNNQLSDIRDNIEFVLDRNEALQSVELRRERDQSIVVMGSSEPDAQLASIEVPLFRSSRQWGELVFMFADVGSDNILDRWRESPFGLILFTAMLCAPAYYFYLGRMLKELNPSSAVPGRVRSALDTIAEALIVLDRHENIVLANAAFASLRGVNQDDLIGVNAQSLSWVPEVVDKEEFAGGKYPWMESLSSGTPVRNAMIGFMDSDNTLRKFQMNCSPVTGSQGRVGGILISMDDVTELEEKELLLRDSMRVAEEANEAKSAFLSNMSHEIRTPMTAILGFTEVLRRGLNLSEDDQQKHLKTISNSGTHLLELINDVLDLSKVESGAMDVESIETHVPQLVGEVIKVLKVKAVEKSIGLEMNVNGEFPAIIRSDPSRLRQIITNLVGNAIKFTEQGSVDITVEWESSQERVRVAVTDSGIGMSESQLSTIFDAFTQADSSITRRFGGTGLGLSISKKLAEALGGDIVVESRAGIGSTFNVYVATGDLTDVEILTPSELLASTEADDDVNNAHWTFPERSVLVVDDAAENRELLSIVLSDLGLAVTLASNGQEAVDQVGKHEFDIVLMDIQMPIMDGYEAVTLMRQQGIEHPIVALTANAMKGYEEKILNSGFSHYQTKPIDLDGLTKLLAKLLGGRLSTDSERQLSTLIAHDIESDSAVNSDSVSHQESLPIYSSLSQSNPRLASIVDRFLDKLQPKLALMQQAKESGDWVALQELAHWLKGSGGTVGFSQLFDPALSLEEAANAHNKVLAQQCLDNLRHLIGRLSSGTEAQPNSEVTDISEERVTEPVSTLSNSPVEVDTPVISEYLATNPKFEPIIDRFIDRLESQLDLFEKALNETDYPMISELAHWLKGSGGSVGFDGFTELAKSLEMAAQQESEIQIRKDLDAITRYSRRVIAGRTDLQTMRKSA